MKLPPCQSCCVSAYKLGGDGGSGQIIMKLSGTLQRVQHSSHITELKAALSLESSAEYMCVFTYFKRVLAQST